MVVFCTEVEEENEDEDEDEDVDEEENEFFDEATRRTRRRRRRRRRRRKQRRRGAWNPAPRSSNVTRKITMTRTTYLLAARARWCRAALAASAAPRASSPWLWSSIPVPVPETTCDFYPNNPNNPSKEANIRPKTAESHG